MIQLQVKEKAYKTQEINMKERKKIHYGWVIILAGFIIMGIVWTITFNIPNLFIPDYASELGLSRKLINLSFTIRSACQLLVSLAAGYIFKKYDMVKVMKLSALTYTLGIYLSSRVNSALTLYLCTILNSLSTFLITIIPLSIIINNWFDERTGFVTGLSFMGSGVGTAILSPMVGNILNTYSFREAYVFLALVTGLFLIPTVFFILKSRPEQMGLKPYGYKEREKNTQGKVLGQSLSDAKKSHKFYLILISTASIGMGINGLLPTIAPHLSNLNYDIQFVSKIVSMSAISLAISKILLGSVFDKAGIWIGSMSACLANALGLVAMFMVTKSDLLLLAIVVFSGYGCAYGTVGGQNIIKHMYGPKDYGNIYSYLQAAAAIGSLIIPLIMGFLYDISGNYYSSILVSLGFTVLAMVLLTLALPKQANEPY